MIALFAFPSQPGLDQWVGAARNGQTIFLCTFSDRLRERLTGDGAAESAACPTNLRYIMSPISQYPFLFLGLNNIDLESSVSWLSLV